MPTNSCKATSYLEQLSMEVYNSWNHELAFSYVRRNQDYINAVLALSLNDNLPTLLSRRAKDSCENRQIQSEKYSNSFVRLKQELENHNNLSWKVIICFVGAPWAGKTTQKKILKERINPEMFHMSGFVKGLWQRDFANTLNAKWELITGYEEQFLEAVWKTSNAFVILDWFPRSEEQVVLLYEKAIEMWWDIKTICLDFPEGDIRQNSLGRQRSRAEEEGKWEVDAKREGKLRRYFEQDKKAISATRFISPNNFVEINALDNLESIHEKIEEFLMLDSMQGKFDQDILEKVLQAEKETGTEMWLGAGLVYRNYFNGKYWPIRDSFDKDIHISQSWAIRKTLDSLERIDPDIRWSVDSRFQDTEELYGVQSKSMEEAMTTFPLTFRQVGIRLNEKGKLSVAMSSQAKYDLENGIIRIDEWLLKKVPAAQQQSFLERALSRVHKTLQEYPWLKLEGIIKKLYEQKYGEHDHTMDTDIQRVLDSINDIEFWGKQIWRPETISPGQKSLMDEVVSFYRNTKPHMQMVRYPKKWQLPHPWDKMFVLKQKKERWERLSDQEETLLSGEHMPEWFSSQLDYVSTLCDDEFQEWFFNQVRSRKPLWWKDPFIQKILSYMQTNASKRQKPTHLWLPLHVHSIDVVWQLQTDALIEKFSETGKVGSNSIRRSMRIAMLIHDIWKTKNSLTPGCHEWVWAKIWEKLAPEWIDDMEKKVISWIIETHDVFWRLARSITEKVWQSLQDNDFDVLAPSSYKWSIDPKQASAMIKKGPLQDNIALEVMKEIWRADVSSVSSLSWILGIADTLFSIVEIEMKK